MWKPPRQGEGHMRDLWGEEIPPQQTKRQPQPKIQKSPTCIIVTLTAQDCLLFGHSWTAAGMNGEKLCTTCGIKGYCPVCTPLNKSLDAKPFLCTRHSKGMIQA